MANGHGYACTVYIYVCHSLKFSTLSIGGYNGSVEAISQRGHSTERERYSQIDVSAAQRRKLN